MSVPVVPISGSGVVPNYSRVEMSKPSKPELVSEKKESTVENFMDKIKHLDPQKLDAKRLSDDWWSNWDNFNNWGK